MQRHQPLELVGQLRPVRRRAAREGVPRRIMRVRQVVDPRQQRPRPGLAVRRDAAHRDAAEAYAVVAALAPDETRARGLTARAVPGEGDLQCRVDRFRSGVGEKHVIEPLGRDFHQLVCQRERPRMTHLEGRRVVQGLELARDRLSDLPAAVSRVDAPQSRDRIEDLSPLGGPVVHAARFREQPGFRLELAVGGEGQPERFEFRSAQRGAGVRHGGLGTEDSGRDDK